MFRPFAASRRFWGTRSRSYGGLGEGVQQAREDRDADDDADARRGGGGKEKECRGREHENAAGQVGPRDKSLAVPPIDYDTRHGPEHDHGQQGGGHDKSHQGAGIGELLQPQHGRHGEGLLADRADDLTLPQQGEVAVPKPRGR
jgi:hypothetical protein